MRPTADDPAPSPRSRRSAFLRGFFAIALLAPLAACATDQRYTQTELISIQSREFDAGFDATYDAALNALFDAGYMIGTSDKAAGFVSASRIAFGVAQLKIDAAGRRTAVRISTGDGGQQHVDQERIHEILNLIDRRLVADAAPPGAPPSQRPGR